LRTLRTSRTSPLLSVCTAVSSLCHVLVIYVHSSASVEAVKMIFTFGACVSRGEQFRRALLWLIITNFSTCLV
jgi:hypothetical protein